ncbi:MAG: SUMF1/EgtB/PvdO family nonheme iron enzyme [Acidobacteria bacterium]|nr:SUMF1/EgtB/PvdO family nonheme iron enzyme [Acidobacteriota bacterium]
MVVRVAVLTAALMQAAGSAGIERPVAAVDTGLRMEFVSIPPGAFVRGLDTGAYRGQPAHRVRISRAFELGKYEVTQAQSASECCVRRRD